MDNDFNCLVNNKLYDLTEVYQFIENNPKSVTQAVKMLMIQTNLDIESSKMLVNKIAKDHAVPRMFNGRLRSSATGGSKKVSQRPQPTVNIPKCPVCGSTNLSKITTAKKATKIAFFGIFGMGDNGKTWKCNNCDSRF